MHVSNSCRLRPPRRSTNLSGRRLLRCQFLSIHRAVHAAHCSVRVHYDRRRVHARSRERRGCEYINFERGDAERRDGVTVATI